MAIFAHGMSSLPRGRTFSRKFIEPQSVDQFQREPRPAELQLVFDAHIRRVDLDPLGLELAFVIEELELRVRRLLLAFGRPLHAGTFGLLELPSQATVRCRGPRSVRYDSTNAQYAWLFPFFFGSRA